MLVDLHTISKLCWLICTHWFNILFLYLTTTLECTPCNHRYNTQGRGGEGGKERGGGGGRVSSGTFINLYVIMLHI